MIERIAPKLRFRWRPPVGSGPGTLVIPEGSAAPKLRLMHYEDTLLDERTVDSPEEAARLVQDHRPGTTVWLDVQGMGDEAVLREIARLFGIHPLALEDVVDVPQRPKAESYEKNDLIIFRMMRLDGNGSLDVEQLSLVVGDGYIVTFQERPGDVLEPVRERIRKGSGRIRHAGPDYLAYALLDVVIDAYYPVVEAMNEELEDLEDKIMERPSPALLNRLTLVRRTIARVRRSLWPQQEALRTLLDAEEGMIAEEVRVFLRDTLDHTIQLLEFVDAYRDASANLLNVYLSVMSHRTNEVMKVLTIMASIFIPLTFIAGVYGMNFEHMPELHAPYAYPMVWGVMLATFVGMLIYFRRKGWLGGG